MLGSKNNNTKSLKQSPSFRGALISSGIMAFAGLGDAILYPILPVYAEQLGIPLLWVGLLLSVNRFVRIIANTWIANLVNVMGMKKMLFVTACFAVITTFLYGLKLGLISFVLARIIWGLSYSGLKIATLNYAAKVKKKTGLIFGLSQSIKSIGALLALSLGPILIDYWGLEKGLFMMAAVSLIAIFLNFFLPNTKYRSTEKIKTKLTFSPSPINLLIAIHAIAIDGILVVVLAVLWQKQALDTSQLLILVASYLLLKRLLMVAISAISGFLTLKILPIHLFNFSIVFCIFGMLLIAFGYIAIGIILAFLFNTIIVTFSPLIAIHQQKKKDNPLQMISSTSTWWDLGAGTGAFLGLILIETIGQQSLFLLLAMLTILLFTNFIIQDARANRAIIQTALPVYPKENQ